VFEKNQTKLQKNISLF